MSQTTMKIDREVLAELKKSASLADRTPQRHINFLLKLEKAAIEANPMDFDFVEMFDTLVSNAEAGIVTEEQKELTVRLFESGAPVYGENDKGVWGQNNPKA